MLRFLARILFVFAISLATLGGAGASVLEKLVQEGKFDAAREFLTSRPHEQYHRFHLEGLIAKQKKKYKEAENFFRAALAAKPDYKPSQRQLANTLFLAGNFEAAEHHFENLAGNAGSEAEQQHYDRILETIKSKRPWGYSFYFGFLPSTNVNRGSSEATVSTVNGDLIISDESQGQSGIGITTGISAFRRFDLDDDKKLLLSGSIGGNFYEASEFNTANGILSTEFGKQNAEGSLYAGVTYRHTISDFNTDDGFSGGDNTTLRYGPTLRGHKRLNKKDTLSFRGQALWQEFKNNEDRDGMLYQGTVSWNRILSTTTSAYASVGIIREVAERDDLSHTDWTLGGGFSKKWEGGLSTTFFGNYLKRRHDENFLLTTREREDDRYAGGVSLLHPALAIKGFAPKLTYTYTLNDSTIEFFEYDSHDVSLIWTKKF